MWPFRSTDKRILDLNRKLSGMTAVADRLRADKARAVEANKTLQRLVEIQTDARDSALRERNAAREQLAERDAEVDRLTRERDQARTQLAGRDELIARMDAEHADLSGQLQTALERIAELEECL